MQIILNGFRRKPAERVLPARRGSRHVGIMARVPLASGLLPGKLTTPPRCSRPTTTARYNRAGEEFDVGETFAGVPYEVGVQAASRRAALTPPGDDGDPARAEVDR